MNRTSEEIYLGVDQLFKDGAVDRTFAELLDPVDKFPNFGLAHNLPGWIYETRLSEFDEAMKNYHNAIRLSTDSKSIQGYLDSVDRCKEKLNHQG